MRITTVSSGWIDHPGVDLRRAFRGARGFGAERKVEAEREPAADRGGADEEERRSIFGM